MLKSLIAGIGAIVLAGAANAQCTGYVRNVETAFDNYEYYSAQHPIVSSAFDDVLRETILLIQDSPRMWNNPDAITFEDIAPALGSLIGFAIICDLNQPHCDRFLRKVDPVVGSLIFNISLGYSENCWS